MKIAGNSIRVRILVPIFAFVTVITIALLLIVLSISHSVSIKYFEFMLTHHSMEVSRILDTAVTELISARLLDKTEVVEAKQKIALEELAEYWDRNKLEGLIIRADGTSLYSSLDSETIDMVRPFIARPGPFHLEMGLKHINGYTNDFRAWGWKVSTIHKPVSWFFELQRKEILLLFPAILFGLGVLISSIFFVFRRNFQRPVANILSDLHKGGEIRGTGVAELDTIVKAINDFFSRLRTKTEHVSALHDIAISLNYESRDQTINSILDKASRILGAEFCALVLFDEKKKLKKFFARGTTNGFTGELSEGKEVSDNVFLSAVPTRINDMAEHPAFNDIFPEGHPVIKNIIVNPIFSAGRHLGALCFANKPGGFGEEDEALLGAVSADTAIALAKAENLIQLKRFSQVIASAFDLVLITDERGYITYVNPACERVTGYADRELIGEKADVLFGVQGEVLPGDVWNTLLTGNAWRGEFLNRKKDGETYHTSAVIFPLRGDERTSYASIQRDITQEKRLYEQLLRAQKLEAIGTLAGGFAHDFNNILTAILGYAELMRDMAKEGDPFFRPASIILNAAEQGAELTKKILSITRKEKAAVKPVNVNEVIRTSMDLLQRSIPKTIEIVTRLSGDVPQVLADTSQLQQVMVNLAINSRDAMPAGGKLVLGTEFLPRETVSGEDKKFVKLFISDTGVGMDADTQRKIFDPFFTTKETGKGTGLGLYIVHSIVSGYGGHIKVYSEPGMGTTFNLYLPVAGETEAGVKEEGEDLRGSGTVLVIDDEPQVRELCSDILGLLGYRVLSAGGGSEGIEIFREMKDQISVVVLDMIMPKMGGGEVYEVLKAIQPDVRVVLCSGYSQEGFSGIDALMKKGVKKFIQKPFPRLTLGHALKEALRD